MVLVTGNNTNNVKKKKKNKKKQTHVNEETGSGVHFVKFELNKNLIG